MYVFVVINFYYVYCVKIFVFVCVRILVAFFLNFCIQRVTNLAFMATRFK